MDNTNILKNMKKCVLEFKKQKKLLSFRNSLEKLNIDRINKFLDDGISIEEYEKADSTLRRVLQGYISYLFDIIENYGRKNLKIKNQSFLSKYCKMSENDIPDELKEQIKSKNKKVINLLESLYQKGADINHNSYIGISEYYVEGSNGKSLHKISSVAQVARSVSTISREQSIIDWILEKKELVLESNVIEETIYDDSPNSVEILEKLIKKGNNKKLNSFFYIIINEDIFKKKEKFNILWKYATEEEKRDFIENYDLDKFDVPNNNYSSSGLKM